MSGEIDRNKILDALCAMLPGEFDQLIAKLDIPPAILPGASASQATRATDVVRYMTGQQRMDELAAMLPPPRASMSRLMDTYEHSPIWRATLAPRRDDPSAPVRDRLREAYRGFRARSSLLAGEISRDLPDFAVHDATHLDALWEVASIIAGADYLNPIETFVLGGAVLLHDLGMGVAAYPGGVRKLADHTVWKDTYAAVLRQNTMAGCRRAESELQYEATARTLRRLHADHADDLAKISWNDVEKTGVLYLIEDAEIRSTLGPSIGQVAHSSWWNPDALRKFGNPHGAPAWAPHAWELDLLKVAAVLRLADACHIDARRAPIFLATLRQPRGEALAHWQFQARLMRPRLENGRLAFSSTQAFGAEEAEAWWTCYDTLRMIDRELVEVDGVLADTNRPRLLARSVVGVGSPGRLCSIIKCAGWTPIDSRIHVSDAVSLAERLGGANLYGRDTAAALRELLQNARDAVVARRLLEGRPAGWGQVHVRLIGAGDCTWLEVEDSGVGMRDFVLSGVLLDFGKTFWGTDLSQEAHLGLEARGFVGTARFGIGFFSVFMLGDYVEVITRPYDEGPAMTHVLVFGKGIRGRPLIRNATPAERLLEGGTRIRVRLFRAVNEQGGLLCSQWNGHRSLRSLCRWLCPNSDVEYVTNDALSAEVSSIATNLCHISADHDLFKHLSPPWLDLADARLQALFEKIATTTADVLDDNGNKIGRLGIIPADKMSETYVRSPNAHLMEYLSAVIAIGFRAGALYGVAGYLEGEVATVSRQAAVPTAAPRHLAQWATRAAALAVTKFTRSEQLWAATIVQTLGGDLGDLCVAIAKNGPITRKELRDETRCLERVTLLREEALTERYDTDGPVLLNIGCVIADTGGLAFLRGAGMKDESILTAELWWNDGGHDIEKAFASVKSETARSLLSGSLLGVAAVTVAEAWGLPLEKLAEYLDYHDDKEGGGPVAFGTFDDGRPATYPEFVVLRRPKDAS